MKTLFNEIEIGDDDIFINALHDIDDTLAFKVIESAIKYTYENGIFSMEEATIAYFALNKIKKLQKDV